MDLHSKLPAFGLRGNSVLLDLPITAISLSTGFCARHSYSCSKFQFQPFVMEKAINKDKCSIGVEADYDVKDAMLFGVRKSRTLDSFTASHPLEVALLKHSQKQEEIDMRMLRTMQGLHAPIRLHMEKLAVKDIGHLPCLHRHNAMLDALTGKDSTMEFEDFLNNQMDSEVMGQPHVMIERQLGML